MQRIMHFIIGIVCAKQGSNLRSLGNIGLSDASRTTRPFARNIDYCSLRDSNPRPWAHKTQILH